MGMKPNAAYAVFRAIGALTLGQFAKAYPLELHDLSEISAQIAKSCNPPNRALTLLEGRRTKPLSR
jgi:hypothetical protein